MKVKKAKYYFYLLLHLIVLIVVILLPFLVHWKIVLGIFLVNYLVFGLYLKHCPLTVGQFGNSDKGFVQYYLMKMGIPITSKGQMILMKYIVPIVVIVTSIIWQVVLNT